MSDELTQLRARVATLEGVARKLIKRLDISTAAMEAYELYPIMRAVNESALASAKSALGEADTKPLVSQEDVAMVDTAMGFMSTLATPEWISIGAAWSRIRQALQPLQPVSPKHKET